MTPNQFMSACARYFGAWPAGKPGVLEAVAGYVKTKVPAFLAVLWKLVRDERPQGYGPPDMACLIALAERAAEHARTHTPPWPLLEDNEPRATMAEVRAALAATAAKLEAKRVEAEKARGETPRPPRAFAYLDNVRWNQQVELSPEYHDEKRWKNFDNWTEDEKAEFWSDYSARYKGGKR